MEKVKARIAALAVATAIGLTFHVTLQAMDVRVDSDKTFDFGAMHTWAWNPAGPGEVKMGRTQDDDPAAMKRKAEPLLLDAVATEMPRHGLMRVESQPDLTLTYYLLLGTNITAQTLGQFLPSTVAWGLPPFAQSTQSLKMMNQGSLVFDLSAKGTVVWRGVAQAKIAFDATDQKREALLREAVRDLLKRYPPKR